MCSNLIANLSDDELVSKWVQAMHGFRVTGHQCWDNEANKLDAELGRRKLGLKRLNLNMTGAA